MRKTISNAAMAAMALLYLLDVLLPVSLSRGAAVAAAVVLAANLPFMGKTFRLPAWVFFLLGAAILTAGRAPLGVWLSGLESMMKTAVILIVMQALSMAMHRGRYEEAVSACLRSGAGSMAGLFCMVMLLAHLLASVMSLGAVVVILAAITPALEGIPGNRRFMAASVSWGYCALFLWAPGTVTVLMSMQVFDLSWQAYFPPAFVLSMLGLGIGTVFAMIQFRKRGLPAEKAPLEADKQADGAWGKVLRLVLVLAMLVAGVTVLERMGFSTSIGRLLMVTLAVAGIWLLAQGRQPGLPGILENWWRDYLPRIGDLSAFFLAMGIFSAAIQFSGFAGLLGNFCQRYQGSFGPWVLPLLPVVIVLFSLVGLHPFVSVLMVGPVIAEMPLPASPLQLGLAMSLGCCLSYMLSPFAGLILALSSGLEEPPARICFQANLAYAVVYYAAAAGCITLLPGGLG